MKKIALFSLLLTVTSVAWCEPEGAKSLAKPTPGQVEWHDMEMEMFLCFDPCTWQNREYDDHSTPLDKINPDKLDTDQWVRVAVSMGAKQILFVAKHTGGFCWWQTDTTDYGVKETPWLRGKGDVMRDLSASCRKAGLKLGVYLSPQDDRYGAKGGGKCGDPGKQAVYDKVYRQQLTEVLTRYGEINEVWYDGGLVIEAGDILKEHAAKAQIFQGKFATIRWVGNEEGYAPYPAWNAVSREAWQRGATAADGDPDGEIWLPNEVDTVNVSPHFWFWNSKPERRLLTLDKLMDCYYKSVGRGAVLLLNQTPDTTGLIPEADARQAAEFGAEVQRLFGKSLAETTGAGSELELDLGKPAPVDHVIIMEDIREGERIREYVIEGRFGTEWKTLAQGTAVGHKKIDRLAEPVEISALRLRCTASEGVPIVCKLAVYHVGASR